MDLLRIGMGCLGDSWGILPAGTSMAPGRFPGCGVAAHRNVARPIDSRDIVRNRQVWKIDPVFRPGSCEIGLRNRIAAQKNTRGSPRLTISHDRQANPREPPAGRRTVPTAAARDGGAPCGG
jgi:hypothetical protein